MDTSTLQVASTTTSLRNTESRHSNSVFCEMWKQGAFRIINQDYIALPGQALRDSPAGKNWGGEHPRKRQPPDRADEQSNKRNAVVCFGPSRESRVANGNNGMGMPMVSVALGEPIIGKRRALHCDVNVCTSVECSLRFG